MIKRAIIPQIIKVFPSATALESPEALINFISPKIKTNNVAATIIGITDLTKDEPKQRVWANVVGGITGVASQPAPRTGRGVITEINAIIKNVEVSRRIL